MEKLLLNHWFINENNMSISLMRFHVSINTYVKDDKLSFVLVATNSNMDKLALSFDSLESAINFTECEITLCDNFNDIAEHYKTKILKLSKNN